MARAAGRAGARRRRHQRNRRPIPFRPHFGTAPIEIVRVEIPPAPNDYLAIVITNGPILPTADTFTGSLWDFTANEEAPGIPIVGNNLVTPTPPPGQCWIWIFAPGTSRVGHRIGWNNSAAAFQRQAVPFAIESEGIGIAQ